MTYTKRKDLMVGAAVAAGFLLTQCAPAPQEEAANPTIETLRQDGHLVVLTLEGPTSYRESDVGPTGFRDDLTGPQGYEVELTAAFAEAAVHGFGAHASAAVAVPSTFV